MPKSSVEAPATSPGSAEFGNSATSSTPFVKKEKKKRKLQDKIKMEIETLVHRRGLAKGKVTKILKTIRPTETAEVRQLSEPQVHVYLKKLETAQKEYMSNHESILAMVDMEGRKQADKHYEEFDDLHDKVALMLEEQLLGFNATRANGTLNATAPPQAPQPPVFVHQPLRMPIPSFDGRYESWPKFKVLFKEVVDKAPDPPAVKLYHLEHALVGGAVGSIDAKTISEGNYAHAWEILEEKYGNKRHAIDRHINGLLNLTKMNKENHVELRGLVDECTRHVESLKFLEQEFTGISELIVVHLLGAALDKDTRRRWESEVKKGELPQYDKMLEFLKAQCFVMERCEDLKPKQPTVQPKPAVKSTQKSYAVSTSESETRSEDRCDICGKGHRNHACPEFKELPLQQRMVKIREHNLCFNCLRKGHPSKKCTSPGTCSKCKRRHHSLLHSEERPRSEQKVTQAPPEQAPEVKKQEAAQLTTASCHNETPTQQVLLLTAVVDIMDRNNKAHPCRVLLDSASQANLISKAMVESLGLKQFPSNVTVAGIDGTKTHASSGSVVQLRSRYSSFSANIKCLVTERVTADLPTSAVNVRSWELPPGVQLADPSFHQPGRVDMLLGNQLFLKLLMPGEVHLAEHLPILRETQFGWVVGGVCDEEDEAAAVVHSHSATLEDLNRTVQRFWELEEYEGDVKVSTEESECELHFTETHRRDATGRYVVELPLKESVAELGDSRTMALRRFYALERKLAQQPELKKQYVEFMEEYEKLGHCKEIQEGEDPVGLKKWYLPHHAVLRPSNTTTKCRVVFDASAKVNGLSLNDVMKVGDLNQSTLVSIVLRFRFPRYVLTTDVAKMYRQVLVDEKHTPLQRVFWRTDPTKPLRVLELTTVTYGTASAPFLATRALQQLARDEKHRFPLAAKIIEEDFYVDNALFGFDDISQAFEAQSQLIQLCKAGGFELHKWSSNCPELLEAIPEADREELVSVGGTGTKEVIKALGLLWNPAADELQFAPLPSERGGRPTKSQVLSRVASIFDPAGIAAPVVLVGKLLMKLIWEKEIGWNQQIPEELVKEWENFLDAIRDLDKIRVPRRVVATNAAANELHGYADASKHAYGACVYVKSIIPGSPAELNLLCAKSKLVPKTVNTIPRSELLASRLLHRLVKNVLEAVDIVFRKIVLWSDSQVVLAWLKKKPDQLEVFVKNRVAEIVSTGDLFEWRYVRTADNPADIVSRGMSATKLAKSEKWKKCAEYQRSEICDMEEPEPLPDDAVPELRRAVVVSTAIGHKPFQQVFEKFESFRELQRIFAYVVRFCRNCKEKVKEKRIVSRYPTNPEMRESQKAVLRAVQHLEFAAEIACLEKGESSKKLNCLNPFLDDGLLRVGGRLRHSRLPYATKHQWILPQHNKVVQNLVRCIHKENLHAGPLALLAAVRRHFWIPNARSLVRKITRSCVQCFKVSPTTAKQFMGDLPTSRCDRAPAFQKVGLDFAGPFLIKQAGRKAAPVKGYVCVFVCMVTKGIHLEAVESLSTEAFIAALLRFVSRRGLPEELFSDNGTNFVGANHELHDLYKLFQDQLTERKIFEFCQPREIQWSMIPPGAPHMGGIWEAGVKSTKTILKKVCNTALLTMTEFATLLCQIEAQLNSRPLYAQSEDPTDPEPLTPGHFLIDRPLTAIPEPTYEEIPTNRLSRWQYVQVLRDNFWKRWSREYLVELQARGKWTRKMVNVRKGTVVMIKEDNLPPQSWRLGVVTETYPGPDKMVRVVDLRTRSGILKRPIHKLAPLPILDNAETTAASGGEDVRAENCQPEENFTCEQCPTPRLLRSTTKLATARR